MAVNALQVMRPLTQEERTQAMKKAREAVRASFGDAPQLADFVVDGLQLTWVDRLIWFLCIVVLVCAFMLSAMRLFHIGRETFLHSINHETSAAWAGAFIVVLAETTQVISALALAKVNDPKFRLALHFVSLGATAIAIVGNLQVVKPFQMNEPFEEAPKPLRNPFAWLEALLPPLFVLAMAHVLKHQLLDMIAAQEEQKAAYESALQEWHRNVTRDASMHPEWTRFYANALRDALRTCNARTKAGKEALPQLTVADWRALVYREMQAENWYADAPQVLHMHSAHAEHGSASTEANAYALQSADASTNAPALYDARAEQNATASMDAVLNQTALQSADASMQSNAYAPAPAMHKQRTGNGGGGNSTDEVTSAMQAAKHLPDGRIEVHCPYCSCKYVKPNADAARMALTSHIGRWCPARNASQDENAMQSAYASMDGRALEG
jgi:hypothetical protein